jgi:hypothetical protein
MHDESSAAAKRCRAGDVQGDDLESHGGGDLRKRRGHGSDRQTVVVVSGGAENMQPLGWRLALRYMRYGGLVEERNVQKRTGDKRHRSMTMKRQRSRRHRVVTASVRRDVRRCLGHGLWMENGEA